ncbi:MAG: metallophosphoesterase family protein [Acidobacteria bacterium]|nr:metallophosphoesterase family protein [Acidobacteriota bacterium]
MSEKLIAPLTVHRGLATWGEKLVPLAAFRQAAAETGLRLTQREREAALRAYRKATADSTPVEGPYSRIAVFGGVYSNHLALAEVLEEAARRGAEAIYCLGDLGAFGPSPEKVRPLLSHGGVLAIQGNYEESLASGREDCNCGYTDPRDNHFAEISYRYTAQSCSPGFKAWMGTLPRRRRVRVGNRELLLVHGSPRRVNEFLFHSTSPAPFLEVLLDQNRCDGILCTHTGLHWQRRLPSGRDVVNVGVIGRPANDGNTHVWFAMLEAREKDGLGVELLPLRYDHSGLAAEMRREGLPEEFVETVLTGWWTTCLEILPARERAASRF